LRRKDEKPILRRQGRPVELVHDLDTVAPELTPREIEELRAPLPPFVANLERLGEERTDQQNQGHRGEDPRGRRPSRCAPQAPAGNTRKSAPGPPPTPTETD